MNNVELKARIIEANIDIVDINGFKYHLHKIEVGTLKGFKVLLPIFDDIMVGDCIVTTDWELTRFGNEEPVDLCLRVDKFEIDSSPDFILSKFIIAEVTGMFLSSEKCYLRTVGPTEKPFYMATLKVRDSHLEPFPNVLVAFGNQAKRLSTVKKTSVLKCTVTVKERRLDDGYELAVNNFEIISEGK